MTLGVAMTVLAVMAQAAPAVRGVVLDASSKQPIAGASVLIVQSGDVTQGRVVSADRFGKFAIADLGAGGYRVRAEHAGYLAGPLASIDVPSDGAVPEVTLTLTPTAVISGRVTDAYGDPAARVVVRAYVAAHLAAEARTNDLGEYRLFDLAPGDYIVSAAQTPGPAIQGNSILTPSSPCPDCVGEGVGRTSLPLASGGFIDPRALSKDSPMTVFYPGTVDRRAALPIKAAAGAHIEAIDLQLISR